jgi:phospholipase D3/4
VKELGVIAQNCSCLAEDIVKIFEVYWDMGKEGATIPAEWPEAYGTSVNNTSPMLVNLNGEYNMNTYLSSSPPPMSTKGRTHDIDAILDVISKAEEFVHISVMDYIPLTLYTKKRHFWPVIDDALRKVAIENAVSVKLLISWWNHSRPAEDYFLRSLEAISESYRNVDIKVKRFIVPADDDQAKIPFGRVNHNKYMVTDNTAYIGTSNWSGDYFIDTAGIGLVMRDVNGTEASIRAQLASIFERDWNSKYAVELK